jgi:hypothetical protein
MRVTTIEHRLLGYAVAIWLCAGAACTTGEPPASNSLKILEDAATGRFTIVDGDKPVLAYNFGTVPVPAGATGQYAVARSDYVHPLYGLDGETLTRDYSPDHPHHRGIYWAWPEVTWKGEKRDLHALQGVFARPVRIVREALTDDCAVLEAENVWKWGDTEPIVSELATFTVWREKDRRRALDFEFRFTALTDGVTLARRGQAEYGGFNVRLSARSQQRIVTHIGEPGPAPRPAWACLAGVPPEGTRPVSVVLLQAPANPEYPGDWVQFPELNWLQPTFPSKGTAYSLTRDAPLTLRFRVVVLAGETDDTTLQELWNDYAAIQK